MVTLIKYFFAKIFKEDGMGGVSVLGDSDDIKSTASLVTNS